MFSQPLPLSIEIKVDAYYYEQLIEIAVYVSVIWNMEFLYPEYRTSHECILYFILDILFCIIFRMLMHGLHIYIVYIVVHYGISNSSIMNE